MIDIHAPEHSIMGVRDFFLHLFTITIGLLIALSLEAGVEAMHHRHQRKEAETTIRQELTENRVLLIKTQANTQAEIRDLNLELTFLEDLRAGKKDDPSGIKLNFNSEPLQNASWSTASATGALSYMPYEQAQRFAVAYQLQQIYMNAVATAWDHYEVLDTYVRNHQDPREMKAPDIETAIPDLRRAMAGLNSMSDLGRGTLITYDDALKQ